MYIFRGITFLLVVSATRSDDCSITNAEDESDSFNWTRVLQTFRYGTNVLNGYELLMVVPSILLRQFVRYSHVATFAINIPDDVSSAVVTYRAFTIRASGIGANCEEVNVTAHMKYAGYPVVSPQGYDLPRNYLSQSLRSHINSYEFLSDGLNNTFVIDGPHPGKHYVIAFVSWRDPNSDKIEPPGLTTVCQTYFYSDVIVKKEHVEIVNCDETIVTNSTLHKEYFKCKSDNKLGYKNITILPLSCENCQRKLVSIQQGNIPSLQDHVFRCLLPNTNSEDNRYSMKILFQPAIWYYISIENLGNASEVDNCLLQDNKIDNEVSNAIIRPMVKEVYIELLRYRYGFNSSNDVIIEINSEHISILKFLIDSEVDIGGTLTFSTSMLLDTEKNLNGMVYKRSDYVPKNSENFIKVIICLHHETVFIPTSDDLCVSQSTSYPASIILNNTDSLAFQGLIHVPYPEHGSWFVSIRAFRSNAAELSFSTNITISIASSPCILGRCGQFGACNSFISGGFLYSSCSCYMNYGGWDCSIDSNAMSTSEVIVASLLLTLSNLFFIPSVYFAIKRKYFTEAGIYCLTMLFSIFYHACDSGENVHSYCIFSGDVLQYGDFYCGILAFWVTLIAMAAVNKRYESFLHVIGGVLIAITTVWDRFSIITFIVPVSVGVGVVAISWASKMRKRRHLFPSKFYWTFCLPAGIIVVTVGLICFTFLQTNQNYKFVHSAWHVLVAISIFCLLPNPNYFFPKKSITFNQF